MELEIYFEFIGEDAIRIAGTRVGIETVEIVLRYPTLSLEQIHASVTYYLANREKVEPYLNQTTRHWHTGPPSIPLPLRRRRVRVGVRAAQLLPPS